MNNNQINEELLRNMGININFKLLYLFSFLIQWSFLFLILNLLTLGFIRFPLYLIFLLDGISIFFNKNRTILRPSILLDSIHKLIGYVSNSNNTSAYESNVISKFFDFIKNFSYNAHKYYENLKAKLSNIHRNDNKYKKERQLNHFSKDIGKKVYVESISDGKITRKDFKYKDRATSYVNMLKSNNYKDYTKYNLDTNTAKAYLILNKNRDIVNLEKNTIETSHKDNDYKFIIDGWPKK